MEAIVSHLGVGLSAVLALEPVTLLGHAVSLPMNVVYCMMGAMIGTLIGVLPGLGPVATIAMLLPATFTLPPLGGLIMLSGIYYGAQYGGSTTAILVNLPGEMASVVTCIDGYQMARRGRAGVALTTAALGSFAAGCVGTLLLAAFAPPLAGVAFRFGPAEYSSLIVMGLFGAIALSSGAVLKSIAMILLGLLLGIVGTDISTGVPRFTFGIKALYDGIGFVVVAMGVFGYADVIANLEQGETREIFTRAVGGMFPSRADFKRMIAPILRGTALGSALGILPGGGAVLASFGAYALEKKVGRHRAELGHGAIEGVAGPESANNAAAQTSFIPLLTLGLPANAVMALMVGAMMIHNIQPGPLVMSSDPTLFWGLIVSMWVGNLMLVVLNIPLIGIWVRLLTVPYRFLYPAILVFCCIGVYTVSYSTLDIVLTVAFGVLGYVFIKLGCEGAPLLLGLVLGPMLEEYVRRALVLSDGSFSIFFTRPISLGLLLVTAVFAIGVAVPAIRSSRQEAFHA